MDSKIYQSGEKQRKEMEVGDEKTITIIRSDKGVMWTLLSGDMYMEQSLKNAQKGAGAGSAMRRCRSKKRPGMVTQNPGDLYEVVYPRNYGIKIRSVDLR